MAHLLPTAFGADVPFGLPTASVGEVIPPHVRRASRLVEREWSEVKPLLMFALQLTIAATAAAGTILALFAWSGAGL